MSKSWPLPNRFRVRIIMRSDWHVGFGAGRPGNVDRLVIRDSDDLPFVPAKTLHGIWRDACERLCRALDNGNVGPWSQLVDCIFGSQPALGLNDPSKRHNDPCRVPIPSVVEIRSAHIPSPLRQMLARADRRLKQALTFIKPGVAIDRTSGSAKPNCLRFEEFVREGTVLEADCALHLPDAQQHTVASALLIASSKLVDRLGGKRRRGTGRCHLEVIDADEKAAIAWLEENPHPPEWTSHCELRSDTALQSTLVPTHRTNKWVRIPIILKPNSPLAVSYRVVGNVWESLDFVPGTYLLPHVTRCFPVLRPAIAAGDVVVLPAYPEVDGRMGLPVPLAWFVPKGSDEPLAPANRSQLVNRLVQSESTNGAQLKQLRSGFISAQADRLLKTPMLLRTHNTVSDAVQRPDETVGGVYSYEAIAPADEGRPLVLRSELRMRQGWFDQLPPNWKEQLTGLIALGRSKKDDYGSVYLELLDPEEIHEDIAASVEAVISGHELFVWLISDTLIRNAQLQPHPTAACVAEELSRKLGAKVTLRQSTNGCLDEVVRRRRLDTWHVTWGLPRPSLVALQAGSCMVFQIDSPLDQAKLLELQGSGIGERTAEGYGQVCFNHPLICSPPGQWNVPIRTTPKHVSDEQSMVENTPSQTLSEHDMKFARLIEKECWRQEIRKKCLSIANDAAKRKEQLGWVAEEPQGRPPMSQLGAFREQLAMLHSTADRGRVLDWFDHLKSNKRRKDKWPSVDNVKRFLESPDQIWTLLSCSEWPTLTENAANELKQELWAYAIRTFFDACIRAHKRQLESHQQIGESNRGT